MRTNPIIKALEADLTEAEGAAEQAVARVNLIQEQLVRFAALVRKKAPKPAKAVKAQPEPQGKA